MSKQLDIDNAINKTDSKVRTTILLPKSVMKSLKVLAVKNETTLTDLIEQAVKARYNIK